MADYLQIFAPLASNLPVAFGFGEAMDNHNNVVSGRTLTCASKAPVTISLMDWAWLTNEIGTSEGLSHLDGHIPLEEQSPLQQLCRKAAAKTR